MTKKGPLLSAGTWNETDEQVDLKLTPTMTRTADGGVYTSGEWTNSSVRISATTQTGEHPIVSTTISTNGGAAETCTPGSTTTLLQEGMYSIVFKVTDTLGNSLSVPLAINMDMSKPTVSFSPNGNESSARDASVTATVADSGGSGLAESTLEYVWTHNHTTKPTAGWQQLNNGSTLTKKGLDDDWYLHIQGKDTAGNEVYAVSGRKQSNSNKTNTTRWLKPLYIKGFNQPTQIPTNPNMFQHTLHVECLILMVRNECSP